MVTLLMEYFLGLQLKWKDTENLQENLELGLGMAGFRFLNGGGGALQNDEFVMTSMTLYSIRQFHNDKLNFYECCKLALSVMFHACIQEVLIISELSTVGSRFTTGLRSRIFGCKLNRRKTSTI